VQHGLHTQAGLCARLPQPIYIQYIESSLLSLHSNCTLPVSPPLLPGHVSLTGTMKKNTPVVMLTCACHRRILLQPLTCLPEVILNLQHRRRRQQHQTVPLPGRRYQSTMGSYLFHCIASLLLSSTLFRSLQTHSSWRLGHLLAFFWTHHTAKASRPTQLLSFLTPLAVRYDTS
jgi:hypothetical protein